MRKSSVDLKPVQLISFDQDKNLVLRKQAIEIFNHLNTQQLYIVIVAGKYRTGKSYILNRVLLNQNSGFEVSPTINACTKGLWMWPELVTITDTTGKNKKCMIIDTEGLGSLEEGQNTDIKIFLMAILLSSYLIYNSVGNIDEKALQSLSLVINLAEMLHKESNQYDAQQLINSFPSFMWLVRDFSLRLEDQKGMPITSRQYLQIALRNQNTSTNAGQKKNMIRKKLKTFFQDRNCFTLVRPTQNEKDLQNLSQLSEKKLRPEFVKLIRDFKSTIYEELKPKKIRGKSVTPQAFIELCKYFVEILNSGKLPLINSNWDNICVKQSSRIIQDYSSNYFRILLEAVYPQNHEDINFNEKMKKIETIHKQTLQGGFQKIDKSFLGKLEKQLSKQRLEKALLNIYKQIVIKIDEERCQKAKQIVNQIFNEILLEFSSNQLESFEQIFARFEEIKKQYRHDMRIYESFYENSKDVFQEFLKSLKNQWKMEYQTLNKKNGLLQHVLSEKTSQMQEKCSAFSSELRSFEQTKYKYELDNSKKVNQITELKNAYQRLSMENSRLKQQIIELQFYRKQKFEKQLQDLKQKNAKILMQQGQRKQYLECEIATLQHSLKDCQIKERKNQREMQIFKSKCSDYLQQNINQSQEIECLKKKMLKFEKEARKLTPIQHKIKNSAQSPNGQFIESLNSKIDELQNLLNLEQQEKRSLKKLLADQAEANQTLLTTPHQLSYQILKKNYEKQCQSNKKLQVKLKDFDKIFNLCSYRCQLCKSNKEFNADSIKKHVRQCTQAKDVDFDVSYEFNVNGDVQFVIDVILNNYQQQWTITKSIKGIQIYLKKLYTEFPNLQKSQLFQGTLKDMENCDQTWIQERRAYLNQLFNQYREQVWSHSFIMEFFVFDIHCLSEKNLSIPVQNKKESMKSSKVSKISSQLSIDLSKLTDENMDPYENISEGNNLLMRTCKFNKKTFNFGSYL